MKGDNGCIKYKPEFVNLFTGVLNCKLFNFKSANVKLVESIDFPSTVTLNVKVGNSSPYFLTLLSAIILIFFFGISKNLNVSDKPPSNWLLLIALVDN